MIDWKRIAKPQPDGYDSYVIAQLLNQKYGWVKRVPLSGEYTICDGKVAVVSDRIYTDAETLPTSRMMCGMPKWNDEYAAKIDPFLRTWTDGHQMLGLFLDEFWPKWSTFMTEHSFGCTSGHYEIVTSQDARQGARHAGVINAVYVTMNSLSGCAEGIYHEVAHARLEALGMNIETHDGALILNTPDELYESPVRRDKKRPMSAVIQAIYSWIVFGENDIRCAAIPGNASTSAEYLINNLPKIEDGLREIRNHVRCTPEGTAFMDGYFEWGDTIVTRAREVCQQQFGTDFDRRYAKACEYCIYKKWVE